MEHLKERTHLSTRAWMAKELGRTWLLAKEVSRRDCGRTHGALIPIRPAALGAELASAAELSGLGSKPQRRYPWIHAIRDASRASQRTNFRKEMCPNENSYRPLACQIEPGDW